MPRNTGQSEMNFSFTTRKITRKKAGASEIFVELDSMRDLKYRAERLRVVAEVRAGYREFARGGVVIGDGGVLAGLDVVRDFS